MGVERRYKQSFAFYLLKFAAIFCLFYFGTVAIIGLSAPGGYHSAFIQQHLDYVSMLRRSLLQGAKALLSAARLTAVVADKYSLKLQHGMGVHIGFDCLGYGIMSFWIAFIIANTGSWKKKLLWLAGGLLLIWLINITRITLLLVAINRRWAIPFFDHHTWFNIFAYLLIFVLIYFYDRSGKTRPPAVTKETPALT